MTEALIGPLAIAALVVGVAGVAKLRAPATAAGALKTLGLPSGRPLVRSAGALETALCGWSLGWPGRPAATVLACAYAGFAVVAVALARHRAACGCFGDADAPVSAVHWMLSGLLGLACVAAAVWPPQRVPSVTLAIGVAGAAYAVVLAYTQLPAAWTAWGAR